jgi:hypothetical protein
MTNILTTFCNYYNKNDDNTYTTCQIKTNNSNYCLKHLHNNNNNQYEYNIYCTEIIRDFLSEIQNTQGQNNKAILCNKLFKFISNNLYYVHTQQKLLNAIKNKFDEFESSLSIDLQKKIQLKLYKSKIFTPYIINSEQKKIKTIKTKNDTDEQNEKDKLIIYL